MKPAGIALTITFSIASLTIALSEEPLGVAGKKSGAAEAKVVTAVSRPSLDQARRQAEMLHAAMHATLQAVHHHYYREDEGLPIPAVTLKDVFQDLEKEQNVKLRWLAVEGQAMNSDHKPKGSFENEAVKTLKAGKREFERVEHGVYQRAGSITLTNQCLKCHVPDRKNTQNRTAGLIIAIAIEEG
jgi:Protein of unknown function (DUF3365)